MSDLPTTRAEMEANVARIIARGLRRRAEAEGVPSRGGAARTTAARASGPERSPLATPGQVAAAIDVLGQLPDVIRAARRRRGLSYRAAARASGVSESTWHGVEHRGRDPGVIITLRLLRWVYEGDRWA